MEADAVVAEAARAKAGGAQRFCMGAAWRDLKDRDTPKVARMIAGVKALGLETCATLGMLSPGQAAALKDAGLDYYNHNLDTGPDYYDQVVTTRTYQERLDTLAAVRQAGISVCCGGIVGMGETRRDRAGLLHQLAILPEHPESLPINDLMPIAGTPLGGSPKVDGLEFVRMIAAARLVCPKAMVRIAAGREHMSTELQALCFLAGANSIFVGARLLTTANPERSRDEALLGELGLRAMGHAEPVAATAI
jgi:biotin synthase